MKPETKPIAEQDDGEFIEQLVQTNPEVRELSDSDLEELRMRLECLLFSVEAECNRRALD